jgi:hypothetical protein
MTPRILQLRPHFGKQHLQLIEGPAVVELQQAQAQPLYPLKHSAELQQPRVAQPLLLRPGANGQLELAHGDVDEAGGFEVLVHEVRARAQVDADLHRRLALLVTPRVEGGARVARGGLDDSEVVHFLQFDVAAWFGVGVGLLEQSGPVAYAACHGTHVDQFEVVQWPGPVCFCVVDFIFDVWGHPAIVISCEVYRMLLKLML